MNLFAVSWKNILAKPWSSILSIILIAFGVGLLTVIVLFQKQFAEQFDKNQAGIDMVVGSKGSPLQLILNSMFHVDAPTGNIKIDDAKFLFNPKNPYIENAIPLSIGDSYKSYRIVGTNNDFLTLYPTEIAEGKWWEETMDVVLGAQVAGELDMKVGDTFYSSHGFNEGDLEHDEGESFRVKGILQAHGSVIDKLLLTHFTSIWDVHGEHNHNDHEDMPSLDSDEHNHEHNHQHQSSDQDSFSNNIARIDKSVTDFPDQEITSVLVQFKPDKKRAIPVINMPRNINENTDVMAAAPAYELNKLLANVASVLKALSYLAILIGIISALSVFISLYNNLKERRYELGMMRVSGANSIQLFSLILYEALMIGLIGTIVGLLLAHLASWVLSGMLNQQFHYGLDAFRLYPEELLIVAVTLLISLVAGLVPALKAYNTDVIKSLQ